MTTPGARVALAHLLGRLDALPLEVGRHADVGDDDIGLGRLGAGRPARRSRPASPTISRSALASSSARTPSRTSRLSSARNTVIAVRHRQHDARPRRPAPARGRRPCAQSGGASTTTPIPGLLPLDPVRLAESTVVGMRIEREVVSPVVDPVRGDRRGDEACPSSSGWPTTTSRRPIASTTSRRSGTPTASGSPTSSGRGSRSRTAGSSTPATRAAMLMGSTTVLSGRRAAHTFEAFALPDAAGRARGRRGRGPLRPDRRRAHRRAGAPPGQPPAVRPVEGPLVWTTLALTIHADGTRRVRGLGRDAVPPPLGLRPRRRRWRQVRADRLQGLVPARLRQAHPVGRRGLAGARDRGRDRARAAAVDRDHARRAEARDPQGQGGRHARRRRARQARTCSCSSTAWSGVEVGGELVAEMGPGAVLGERALLEGGRAHGDARAVTPCRVAVARADQLDPASPGRGRRGPPPRGEPRVPLREGPHLCGVRGSTPAPGAEFARYGGHTSCLALCPRRRHRADARARRRHGHPPGDARCSTGAPFRGTILLATCTGTTPRACRSSPPPTGPTPASTCTCPSRASRTPRSCSARAMSPPHFPITPGRARGARGGSSACGRGRVRDRRLRRDAPRGPPQGRAHVRLPDRATARSTLAYLPDHGPVVGDGLAATHECRPERSPTASTCSSTTPSTPPRSSCGGRTSGTPRPTTRSSSVWRPASGECCCSTTAPAAPTTSSTPCYDA